MFISIKYDWRKQSAKYFKENPGRIASNVELIKFQEIFNKRFLVKENSFESFIKENRPQSEYFEIHFLN